VRHAREVGISVLHLPGLEGAHSPGRVRLSKLDVEDLLLRPTIQIDFSRLEQFARGTSVVVTGGGGSIGAEICRRVAAFGAARLLIIENSELALKNVLDALARDGHAMEIHGRIADVRDRPRMLRLIGEFKPDLVFHAAALKHVPVVEQEWAEGIKTNVFGSVNVADAAIAAGARAMVMISTDKAIEPVSVLGATKRLAEMYCQALDASLAARTTQVVSMVRSPHPTRLISVRFGNVLASNGSVVPKFQEQIEAGGPVTVTDPDMMRYFMTIREACDLVITSASHATSEGTVDASVYVLNMGKQVKIVELAERMIELAGYEPGKDIDIVFTGLRPGERKQEILFARGEPVCDIGIAGIVAAKPSVPSMDDLDHCLAALKEGIARDDRATIFTVFERIVPEYRGAAA
jgi:FlaA1/EpsC-like NDP-sugar epimerase